MNWERVFPTGYPPIFVKHTLVPMPSWFGSAMVPCRWVEGIKLPLCWWQRSLYYWMEVFCIKVDDNRSSKNLTQMGANPFHTPMVLLQWLSSVSSCGGCSVCYLMASMGWDVYPSAKCTQSCRHPLPLHITWSLHLSSVGILWQTSTGEVIASHWSTPGKSSWPDIG